ncbi:MULTISPECIES: DUF4244 domain-containing protein [Arthrobacter]|uniref:DUF4244 domain-containing protein n=2 Tax=Arthrobacter TaxID=1663 RepID=A0ABU9KL60_9MICC|nr:DUF4244 domain-containing protein [Arthrobacter sp. YJM1]MDP5227573.1 DUF4244 domain-containing protein [Arthrobacter sp. YJM1]
MFQIMSRILHLVPWPTHGHPAPAGGPAPGRSGPWTRSVEAVRSWMTGLGQRGVRAIGGEAGTSTAEYAIATLAAVAFAGLLVVIMRSDEVRGFLLNIIRTALAIP